MDTPIILPDNLIDFLKVYPEFKPLFKHQDDIDRFESIYNEVKCIYPNFSNLECCDKKYPFYMLVAHYFVMAGYAISINILPQSGSVASSSVGGGSVGYQSNAYGKNDFSTYLSLTTYGRKYLAWLESRSGLLYVN